MVFRNVNTISNNNLVISVATVMLHTYAYKLDLSNQGLNDFETSSIIVRSESMNELKNNVE